ncbi:hypothetical protein, partial [Leisingera sp. F5]|uniref:hypothetical protein n=1 Tax=Leisingera sp. F5 TaxID=1813816 RepID=UPI0025BE64AA
QSVNLIYMLRARAARRSAAPPNVARCIADENAAFQEGRRKSETLNSRSMDKSGFCTKDVNGGFQSCYD